MQSNVDEILAAGKAISFEGRDGDQVQFDLVTARNFKESAAERILLVGHRSWETNDEPSTGARMANGYWSYPVYMYVPALPRDLDDNSDYQEAERAAGALLAELLPGAEWEFDAQDVYPAQMSSRELITAEVSIKKFATRRFLGA